MASIAYKLAGLTPRMTCCLDTSALESLGSPKGPTIFADHFAQAVHDGPVDRSGRDSTVWATDPPNGMSSV